MRDHARIDRMIELLRTIWHESSDLRLGQLVTHLLESKDSREIWAVEEDMAELSLLRRAGTGDVEARRDPARIDRIDRMIELLRTIWHESSDLRLGQLVTHLLESKDSREIWTVEDDAAERKLRAARFNGIGEARLTK